MVRMVQTCWWALGAIVVAGCSDPDPSPIDAAPIDGAVDGAIDAAIDAETDGPGVDATLLAGGLNVPRGIALAAGHVYIVTGGTTATATGTVARVAIGGGELETLASGQSQPHDLQVSDRVYWTNATFFAANGRSLRAMPLTGGADVTVATFNPGPFALAIDATTAYVARGETDQPLTSAPLAGGATSDLTPPTGVIRDLEVDATHVYYLVGSQVRRVLKSGAAAPEQIASSTEPQALASHGDTLYWISSASVMRAQRDGTGLATVATATRPLRAIAVDDTHVYVAEHGDGAADGRILRVPVGGGELEPLTTARHAPFAIALDAESVYWTDGGPNFGPGAIYKVAR